MGLQQSQCSDPSAPIFCVLSARRSHPSTHQSACSITYLVPRYWGALLQVLMSQCSP